MIAYLKSVSYTHLDVYKRQEQYDASNRTKFVIGITEKQT